MNKTGFVDRRPLGHVMLRETSVLEARTISISIAQPWRDVYEAIWRPERFPEWASGLSRADFRREDGVWRATGPEGPIAIFFTVHNDFGVMDHTVDLGGDHKVVVPLRVVPNGTGAEVMLTLFRQPGMSDETFDRDAEWVRRDLAALKALLGG